MITSPLLLFSNSERAADGALASGQTLQGSMRIANLFHTVHGIGTDLR
jgi:hypothetical protein